MIQLTKINHFILFFQQFTESSIAQLEKTRSSQQTQIQSLQMQVQNLETTVETLGQFMLQLVEKSIELEESLPNDIQRILQQIGNANAQRKKPIFMERKIGKSMSMNAQLGFPTKILEELEGHDKSNGKPKSTFFENTYNQLRKQSIRNRPSVIETKPEIASDENMPPSQPPPSTDATATAAPATEIVDTHKANGELVNGENILKTMVRNDGFDSGFATTPLSPKENSITSIVETIPSGKNSMVIEQITTDHSHPFGNCEDVNFNYSSTQLKSIRPIHLRTAISTPAIAGGEKHIDGRS